MHQMLIQKQHRKLILEEILKEKEIMTQQCFSLLKKQKEPFQIFHEDL